IAKRPFGWISELNDAAPYSCGSFTVLCEFCFAFHFFEKASQNGLFEKCCKKSNAELLNLADVPIALKRLYQRTDAYSPEFLRNIRTYNNALAFTSVNYHRDERINIRSRGIHMFQIYSELYHLQGLLRLVGSALSLFSQLFFYDSEIATRARATTHPHLNRSVL
ncbi:hypothetical protein B0O99DRAFT_457138, partial [Bisporella sp. PMI_857]